MINLMPPKLKESIRFGAYNVRVVQYIFLVLLSGLALAAVIAFGVQIVRSDEAKLEASIETKQVQLQEYSDEIEAAKLLSEKIDTVDVLLQNEIKYSALLQEIARLLPPDSGVRNINLTTEDLEKNLVLEVFLVTKPIAAQLQQNLANSELFTGADIQQLSIYDNPDGAFKWTTTIVVSFDQDKLRSQQ